jgi:hypothetical protein
MTDQSQDRSSSRSFTHAENLRPMLLIVAGQTLVAFLAALMITNSLIV